MLRLAMRRPLVLAAILLPTLALTAATFQSCRRRSFDLSTPDALLQTLRDAGLDYEGQQVPRGSATLEAGYYLRRAGDTRTWEELAAQNTSVGHPETWRGVVRVHWLGASVTPGERPGQRRLGSLLLVGDPEMAAEIAEALR